MELMQDVQAPSSGPSEVAGASVSCVSGSVARLESRFGIDTGVRKFVNGIVAAVENSKYDSAEKPSVHPSRASGRTVERLKSLEIFPFMLSLVEAFLGFFSRITNNKSSI